MLDQYLIIHKSILPDYYDKVLQAKRLLEEGVVREVSQAVKLAGISRSTYYKYKDKILEPSQLTVGRKASLIMHLSHEAGMLSRVLSALSNCNANILTITQSLPIHGKASIMLSIDLSQLTRPLDDLITVLDKMEGVEDSVNGGSAADISLPENRVIIKTVYETVETLEYVFLIFPGDADSLILYLDTDFRDAVFGRHPVDAGFDL